MARKLDAFTTQYIETALWVYGAEGGPATRGDIAPEALTQAVDQCKEFQRDNAHLLDLTDESQSGRDFFLSRNHHGSGFFDREDIQEGVADLLQEAASAFSESELYLGDDGKLYFS